jgi:uncharacterized protein DUF1570
MRRFLPIAVIALLLVAVATPANAGYLIIRVILEGGGGGGSGSESGSPGLGSMKPGGGSGGFQGYGNRGQQSPPPRGSGLGGMLPTPGMGAAEGDTGQAQQDPTRSLVVVVPVEEDLRQAMGFYERIGSNHFTNPVWKPKLHLKHRGDRFTTNLFIDNVSVQLYEKLVDTPAARRTRTSEIHDLHQKWVKSKTDPKVLYNALTGALEAGMVDDAMTYADELLAFASEKPDGLPPEVNGFAQAYKAMQGGIKSSAPNPNSAEQWRLRLQAQGVSPQMHYSIIYWDATDNEVKRRAAMLEENFKGFFLWHATRGVTLPIPDSPLIAVLPKSGADVFRFARALDVPRRMPADGFYSVEHDLLFLSPERLDDLGYSYSRQAQQVYQAGMGRDLLLRGEGPKIHINELNGAKKPEVVARMQTTALIDRLVEDAATVATISREGTRQLLYVTGRLPRFVELPEWLAHGTANFFTRAKDPAFIAEPDNKWSMAVAMTTGYGGPNFNLQRYFKDLVDKKDLHPDRGQLLKNVLTDAYFRGLRDPKDAVDPDPLKPDAKAIAMAGLGSSRSAPQLPTGGMSGYPGGSGSYGSRYGSRGGMQRPPSGGSGGGLSGESLPSAGGGNAPAAVSGEPAEEHESVILRKKRDRLTIKAHATAWSLYYYLTKNHPDKLKHLLDELAALPRDLPLDGDTVVATFCRSVGIDNNKEALTRFANGWLDYIRTVPAASVDVGIVEPKAVSGGTPVGPGGGGLPGMPPGPGMP